MATQTNRLRSYVCVSFRAAVQRGVWEDQHHEEGSCHEGWKLHSDGKVQRWIEFGIDFPTSKNK